MKEGTADGAPLRTGPGNSRGLASNRNSLGDLLLLLDQFNAIDNIDPYAR